MSKIQSYYSLSLKQLVERIVDNADENALGEFHNHRRIFHGKKGQFLCLAEFVYFLQESIPFLDSQITDRAYDLTIDKFSYLPRKYSGRKGIDCRYYFRAFLVSLGKALKQIEKIDPLVQEDISGKLLQGLVLRHFYLSLQEYRRNVQQQVSRYLWQVNRGVIRLWMPVELRGYRRREWLESYIPNPDPDSPFERTRIQRIVDQYFMKESPFRNEIPSTNLNPPHDPFLDLTFSHLCDQSLIQILAREKADTIDKQRPAIRNLGPEKLKKLVERILEALGDGKYEPTVLADDFGLSHAAFSRFAGPRWLESSDEARERNIPDLWLNIARILANNPIYIDAAHAAGVWERITQVIARERK